MAKTGAERISSVDTETGPTGAFPGDSKWREDRELEGSGSYTFSIGSRGKEAAFKAVEVGLSERATREEEDG